jgi:hypothetical protein
MRDCRDVIMLAKPGYIYVVRNGRKNESGKTGGGKKEAGRKRREEIGGKKEAGRQGRNGGKTRREEGVGGKTEAGRGGQREDRGGREEILN